MVNNQAFDFSNIFNYQKYPEWKGALRKRIAELYVDKNTFRELMKLVWAEPLRCSVFLDTDVSMDKQDTITIDDIVFFVMEHNENSLWSGDQEKALESFLKLRDYIGPVSIKPGSLHSKTV